MSLPKQKTKSEKLAMMRAGKNKKTLGGEVLVAMIREGK